MKVLNKLEMQEFEKTFNFLNNYIGSSASFTNSIYNLRVNGNPLNTEIVNFVNTFSKLNSVDEIGVVFLPHHNPLQKINLVFNDVSKARKDKIIQRLIKYCFKAKIQPHRLRMSVNEFSVNNYEKEQPIVTEFKDEINYDDTSFDVLKFGN